MKHMRANLSNIRIEYGLRASGTWHPLKLVFNDGQVLCTCAKSAVVFPHVLHCVTSYLHELQSRFEHRARQWDNHNKCAQMATRERRTHAQQLMKK